jgi:uncharacterized protein YjbJ (UPF0337 family)
MSSTFEKAKGRVKEAAGALTNNPKLKREGRRDQTAAEVKDAADTVIDRVKDALKE